MSLIGHPVNRPLNPSGHDGTQGVNAMSELVNRLVSIQEAREQWLGGIGRTTVYELIKRGELTQVHVGRRGFITSESLAAYVDRLTAAAV
jgi:excisionase family DNA binding protein